MEEQCCLSQSVGGQVDRCRKWGWNIEQPGGHLEFGCNSWCVNNCYYCSWRENFVVCASKLSTLSHQPRRKCRTTNLLLVLLLWLRSICLLRAGCCCCCCCSAGLKRCCGWFASIVAPLPASSSSLFALLILDYSVLVARFMLSSIEAFLSTFKLKRNFQY